MPLPDFVVRLVMRRGYFEHTGAEFEVDGVVAHDRDDPLFAGHLRWQRTEDMAPNKTRETFVARIHRNRGIARDRFGAGGGDGQRYARFLDDFDAKEEHHAVLWLHDH